MPKAATVSLSNAIRTAEQSNNGAPAAAAGIARSASNPDSDVHAYTVLLDDAGRVQSVSSTCLRGEVIADPSALATILLLLGSRHHARRGRTVTGLAGVPRRLGRRRCEWFPRLFLRADAGRPALRIRR